MSYRDCRKQGYHKERDFGGSQNCFIFAEFKSIEYKKDFGQEVNVPIFKESNKPLQSLRSCDAMDKMSNY